MNIFDLAGNNVTDTAKYLADFEHPDGSLKVYYKTTADIQALISDLKASGCEDSELLDENHWLLNTCDRTAGSKCSSGTCTSGSCQSVSSGSFSYCRCK